MDDDEFIGRYGGDAEEPVGVGYDMVMPFVSTKSHGGPHDDDSYACGWEMGALDAWLTAVSGWGSVGEVDVLIHTANHDMAELILTRHGWHAQVTTAHNDDDREVLHFVDGPEQWQGEWLRLLISRDTETTP